MAALMGLCVLGARAQTPRLEVLLRQGERHGLPSDLMHEVVDRARQAGHRPTAIGPLLAPAVSAARRDYPARPLLMTALEGISKQVSTSQLTGVLTARFGHLETAAGLVVETGSSPPENAEARGLLIESLARAHRRGLSWEELRRLQTAFLEAQGTSEWPVLAAAFDVASALSGSSAGSARELLVAALEAGYSASDLRKLPDALHAVSGEGPGPTALRFAARSVKRGAFPGEVRTRHFPGNDVLGPFGSMMPGFAGPPGLGVPLPSSARYPGGIERPGPPSGGQGAPKDLP